MPATPAAPQKVIISQRCLDIDKAVPQHMGISKAILENVIFVHQEEANWPLKESKVLKQKFDDIFSATRYSKALDAIKKLRKEKMDEVKDQKIQLAEKKARVEAKQDVVKRKRQQENQIAELEQQMVECEEDFEENKLKHTKLIQTRDELEQLDNTIKGMKASRDEMVRNKEQLRETIDQNGEEYCEEDSDDELRKWRDQLRRKSDTANSNILSAENDIERKRVEIDEKENFLQKSTRDKVLLEREVEEHKTNVKTRQQRVSEIAQELGMANGSDVDETQDNISHTVLEKEQKLRSLKEKHRRELDVQRRKLSDARNELSQAEEKLKNLRMSEGRDRQQLQELTRNLEHSESLTEDQLDRDKDNLKGAEDQQKKYRQETEQLKQDIRKKAKDEASIKAKKEDLDEEMSNMVSQQDAIRKLDTKREQHNSKRTQVDEAFDKIEAEVRGLSPDRRVGSSEDDVDEFVQQHARDCEKKAVDSKTAFLRLVSSKNQIDARIRELVEDEDRKNVAIAESEKKIKKARRTMREEGDEPWPDLVARREKAVKDAELEAESLRAAAPVYTEFLKKALDMRGPCHGCPVCTRAFDHEEDYREFAARLTTIIGEVEQGDNLAGLDKKVEADTKKLEFCKGKQPVWDELQRMKGTELPEIREELENKRHENADVNSSEEAAKTRSEVTGYAEVKAKELQGTWQRHQRDRLDLKKLKRELDNAESNVLGVTAGREMEAVHNDTERLKHELDEVTSQVRGLYEQQNKNDTRITQLGVQIVERQKKISEAERQQAERKQAEQQRRSLEEKLPGLKQQITTVEGNIEDEKLVLPTMEAEEQLLVNNQRQEEETSENLLATMKTSLAELTRMRNAIEQFVRDDRLGQLRALCGEVEQKQEDKTRLKKEISELEQSLAGMRKSNADQSGMLRNMQDVINFRAKKADIDEINAKIEELNRKKAKIAQDPDWERQLNKLTKIVQAGLTERGEFQGSKNQCEDELRKLTEELKLFYKADEEYRTTLITVKTLELGSADLDKYHQALDKALVTFHAEKMKEVNEIAKFLWGQTYKGQDIESIEIRADEAGKKSYNYRLLMKKGNAELDMRGRCSAGQKVLAALVIRLALAETFCLNCGILALDEPTTNLDVENIKSLCNALKEIITQRKRQKNFQLIIITHDEDFMSELARVDGICDTYYRVSKNEQTQTSVIEEQDLTAAY